MAQNLPAGEGPGPQSDEQTIARLVGDIVADAQKLVRQEIALARVELQEEWNKTKAATASFAVAVVMAFVTIFIAGMAAAYILEAIGVPLWLSFVIVTAVYGIVAAVLVSRGRKSARKIDFVPRQTVETIKENVQWIRNQT